MLCAYIRTKGGAVRAVLQCAVLGQDLRRHWQHAFQPGEARELQLATIHADDQKEFYRSKTFKCLDPPHCSVRTAA